MSVHIASEIWKATTTPSEKLILLKLADHADDDGRCWPSLRRLIRETCLGKTTVCRVLREMEEKTWIQRCQREGTSTVYRINLDALGRDFLEKSGGGVSHHGTGGVPPRHWGGVPPRDQNHHSRTTKEPPSIIAPKPPAESTKVRRDRTDEEITLAGMVGLDLFASEKLKAAWGAFKGYRAVRATRPLTGEKRAPWTERAALTQKRTLEAIVAKWGEAAAIEQINRSIDRRWLDIYEPKTAVDRRPDPATMSIEQLKKF